LLHHGEEYDLDFDHKFLASKTWDALPPVAPLRRGRR
jgi:hypothetical protein